MRRLYALVALTALVLSGCASSHRAAPRVTEVWRNQTITPIGQPVAVGDTLVVYGTVGRELYLYGVSPADGSIRWRQAASPSHTLTGSPFSPGVVDKRVAYFRPDPKVVGAVRLVVANPEDGNDLLVSDPAVFYSQPRECSDGKDVCLNAADGRGGMGPVRFSVTAHGVVADPSPPPPGSRYLGENLLDLGERQPELLAGFHDGVVQWRMSLSRFFSPGHTSDIGWYFELFKADHLHVGSVGYPADRSDPSVVVRDLATGETSAIDATSGVPVWRDEGTKLGCDANIDVERSVADGRWEPWPVRCRYQGTARYDQQGAASYQGLDVTIEGFDVPTGRTTWSVPLGAAQAFMDVEKPPATVSESEVLVQAAKGPLIVDLATGKSRRPAKGVAFWCRTEVLFDYHEPGAAVGSTTSQRRGGRLLDTCAADGSHSASLPSYIGEQVGAKAGGRTVVGTAQGLVAYERATPPTH
jgi:outer membrane protein assembly factor BamB